MNKETKQSTFTKGKHKTCQTGSPCDQFRYWLVNHITFYKEMPRLELLWTTCIWKFFSLSAQVATVPYSDTFDSSNGWICTAVRLIMIMTFSEAEDVYILNLIHLVIYALLKHFNSFNQYIFSMIMWLNKSHWTDIKKRFYKSEFSALYFRIIE